jgi:hypothetical protein
MRGGLTAGMEAVGLDVFRFESAGEFEGCEVVCCFGLAICDPWVIGFSVLDFPQYLFMIILYDHTAAITWKPGSSNSASLKRWPSLVTITILPPFLILPSFNSKFVNKKWPR